MSRKDAHTCGRAAGEFHKVPTPMQLLSHPSSHDVSPSVFPGFEPLIDKNHTVCPPCICLLSLSVRFVLIVGCSWFGSPFECLLCARCLKGSIPSLQILPWAPDKPIKLIWEAEEHSMQSSMDSNPSSATFFAEWLEADSFTSLSLGFHTCKMELIIKPNSRGCGDVIWWSYMWRI